MLKILIVDDDPLTRKGIRMMMPWEKHHMEIVGEASNGRLALDFLSRHEADLVLVDLDMPVMNGTDFIEAASALYPDLNYVVLTVHTEFEYIQNVLRLGAIDYIAKTQFDQENFDQILDRINAAIAKKAAQKQNLPSLRWRESKILYPFIYALITIDSEHDEQISLFWDQNGLSSRSDIYELMPGIWAFTDDRKSFSFPESFSNAMLLCVSDVSDMTYAQLGRLLRKYRTEQFFYDYRPQKEINHKHAYELQEEKFITDNDSLEKLKADWLSLNWVHENELFNRFRLNLKNSRLTVPRLYHLLFALENVWNASYSELTGQTLTLPASFSSWSEVEDWLTDVYRKTNLFSSSTRYSREVTQNILAVKTYIDSHCGEHLDSTELARSAGMSYGYFSRCFHDIVGVSFSDYCIQMRIRQAKEALLNTTKSVQQIASEAGYEDEKYFSRLYKKVTGLSPSEYRRKNRDEA